MSDRPSPLGWGHINVNVGNLERSVAFYEKLGFSVFMPGIPYLGVALGGDPKTIPQASAEALGLPAGTRGRACIMQLDDGLPKLDLTELSDPTEAAPRAPLQNADVGLVRFCLFTEDLATEYAHLIEAGVEFITPPSACRERLADIAICRDPDGTLIELIQVYLENWR